MRRSRAASFVAAIALFVVLIAATACDEDRPASDCTACASGEVCVDGACTVPPACRPETCSGCCDGDTCLAGDATASCGVGGASCEACTPGATCEDGRCRLPCNATTCAGCCDDNGECREGGESAACGQNGDSCVACGGGDACVAGECSAEPTEACLDSCDGCCDGDTCVVVMTAAQCVDPVFGACMECAPGLLCGPDGCEPDPSATWDVIIESVSVPDRTPDGEHWDAFGGKPDLRVDLRERAGINSDDWTTLASTSTASNVTSTTWSPGAVVGTALPSDKLRDGRIGLFILDEDAAAHDPIEDVWQFGAREFQRSRTNLIIPVTIAGTPDSVTITYRLVLH